MTEPNKDTVLEHLFKNNRDWAAGIIAKDPDFFKKLADQQSPEYLWIGCSDSRVPANELLGLLPGDVFVHRNIANVVVHSDLNFLSVLQFAVEVLAVKHVIVCGHYGCSGVHAAMTGRKIGLADNWLRHVQDVRNAHMEFLQAVPEERRVDALVELNVIEQARNVCLSTVVEDAWVREQQVIVHGWVYGLHNGLLKDLSFTVASMDDVGPEYQRALFALRLRYLPTAA